MLATTRLNSSKKQKKAKKENIACECYHYALDMHSERSILPAQHNKDALLPMGLYCIVQILAGNIPQMHKCLTFQSCLILNGSLPHFHYVVLSTISTLGAISSTL